MPNVKGGIVPGKTHLLCRGTAFAQPHDKIAQGLLLKAVVI